MLSAVNSTCGAEAEPAAAADDAEAETEAGKVHSEIKNRTDAQKLWVLCLRNVYPDPRQ